jgi:tRNA dimethylallyltransferase
VRIGGVVVNADSMQVYDVLRILTARPAPADMRDVPHLLYGHVQPDRAYSAAAWLADVSALAARGAFQHRRPVFVGGTGLYFRALEEGLSPMPDIPEATRSHWRSQLDRKGAAALHDELSRLDPDAANRLRPRDGQRIVRALEVLSASGRSILAWQSSRGQSMIDDRTVTRIVLEPDREVLSQRISHRFDAMVDDGGLDEVRAMLALDLDPALPAAKAIGLRELAGAIGGAEPLDSAIEAAKAATRRYAKRQATWFRNQLDDRWARLRTTEAARAALESIVAHNR